MPLASRSESNQSAKWPRLDEVLSETTSPPYALGAFVAYLSENHCLETLEFTLAAKHYCETYYSPVDPAGESIVTADSPAGIHLCMLFRLLLATYVVPGVPHQVNLSVNVRSSLLRHKDLLTPPLPEFLEPSIRSIRELMENSIFLLFLNSRATSSRDSASEASNSSDVRAHYSVTSSDNESTQSARLNFKRPFLRPLRRNWSWPPWSRQPD
ncbi:Regulator of G protein signaling superfamily [Penicillium italicum]|uniref:Regulator of G protein signaling superfamily n=1 Tax=Penicillium italicum TaxID=40296 RepID=A0A0A2LED8_PENIT|nr:Regulator of G protein signaling superfamily [Penicillium italicum]